MRRTLVVGNWKMNGSLASNAALLDDLLKDQGAWACDAAVCAPFPYLAQLNERLRGTALHWGAQDCSAHVSGAYTGQVSPAMVAEFGCRYVIVGHSERRAMHGESDQLIADKAKAALAHGLTPIVCVGETLAEREAGVTDEIVRRQLSTVIQTLEQSISQIVIAYEPVWAIGTGRSASPDEAQAVHAVLRAKLRVATEQSDAMQILYGGSVNASNAATLFAQPDIDGGLIGGASLKSADFAAICRAH